MVMLKNPKAQATKKQLYRLHQLTTKDTRNWKMTMQEASNMIGNLELEAPPVSPAFKAELDQRKKLYVRPPFTEAHVTIISGDQRQGKTSTAVARIVDAYYNDCVRVYCENVLHIKCEPKGYNYKTRMARIKYNGGLKQLQVPNGYKMHSAMPIFSNVHLYGIPHYFCPSFGHILTWLKQGVITNCWLLADEAYVGMNARASMQALGKALANQYWQFGKMQLDVIIVTPMARLIDWELRTIPTEHIGCEYNPKTEKITLAIRKRGVRGERKLDYASSYYRRFYDTNQRIVQ